MAMRCPICKSPVAAPEAGTSGVFPFCSERCKLIDLGRWLDGKYQIPIDEDEDTAPTLDKDNSVSDDDDS